MLPKLCSNTNKIDITTIEKSNKIIKFSLFNKTPLKINSSEIGEIKTVVITPLKTNKELLINSEDITNEFKLGKTFKIKSDK